MVNMRALHKQIIELRKELELIDTHEMALSQRVKRIEAQLQAKELEDKVKAIHEAITKAHLILWFNSEGKPPTSVMLRLQDIGFKPSEGKHDFIYDWKQGIGLEEITKLRDTVHEVLRGSKVLYKLETS